MAAKFPLSLKQVLPILQLIGGANKHFFKVRKRRSLPKTVATSHC